jgi:hypothetical protein
MGSPYSTGAPRAKTKSYAMLVAFDLLELDGADDDALGGGPLVRVKSTFAAYCIKTCVRLRPRPALS